MMTSRNLFALLRPRHWIKNLLLFFPLVFGGQLTNYELFFNVALGFIAFSLMSSAVYTLNDISDIEYDRDHPSRQHRPLAAGTVSVRTAWGMAFVLILISGGLAFTIHPTFGIIVIGYLLLMQAYNLWLKHFAILDISVIATGFLLRIISGGVIADIAVSKWLLLMTFLLAIFLALGKRRNEIDLIQKETGNTRKALSGYNKSFVDLSLILFSSITVVVYILYTVSPEVITRIGSDYVYLTCLPVLLGILRYLQLVTVHDLPADPIKVFYKDHFIKALVIIWIGIFILMLYA